METAKNQIPLTRIQKLIGKTMLESKQTKANGYMSVAADITQLNTMRREYSRKSGVRATTNDFFILAIARAAEQYPLFAAAFDNSRENLVISSQIGVGFAVAAPQGLVVPVLKDVSRKSLIEVASQSDQLLNKARSNRLVPDDFDGANVVLTGLGMYGIRSFYAISPPSASAILSIGLTEDTLTPADDGTAVRKLMDVSLAYDGQIMDEFYAAGFLQCVAMQIQDPWSLT